MPISVTKKYAEDIHHWAKSSTQFAECSFEPGTPSDVGIAVGMPYHIYISLFTKDGASSYKFLAKRKLPSQLVSVHSGKLKAVYASLQVKGGGHIGNPGFSSTPGVQIAMSRFCNVDYDPTTQTVTLGAGQIWDNVYAELERHDVNVVGGRVSGVGVAGFILGGGMFNDVCD